MKLPQLYDIFREKWEKYQSVWLISDTHFDDEELYVGTKHVTRANSEDYVKLINSKCGKNDLLIHLGDVGNLEAMKKVRAGYKILICGNHDAGATIYKEVFDEVYTGPLIIGEKLILSHEPVDVPWAANIHGHCHSPNHKDGPNQYNICPDATGDFNPINLGQILKHSGFLSRVQSLHRSTIDLATKRKNKRKEKRK